MSTKDDVFFSGFFVPMNFSDFKESQLKNKRYANRQNEFYSLVRENKDIDGLRMILNDDILIQGATSTQLMFLFTSFRDLNAFDEMIALYEKSDNLTFKDSLMVNEQLMVAYNKKKMPDKTIKLATKLINEGKTSGDVYGALGKAYLLRSQTAENESKKKYFLSASKDAYEFGFVEFGEFYPGINAVYRFIDLGDLKKAKELANVVYLSCKKEGSEETNDYWCTTTMIEAGCIAGKSKEELQEGLEDLLNYDVPAWQFNSTIETLQNVNKNFKSENVQMIIDRLKERVEGIERGEKFTKKPKKSQLEAKLDSIISNSYSYRGLASNFEGASSVGGNFKFGGQLPDHSISRKDIEIFDGILERPLKDLFPSDYQLNSISGEKSLSSIEDVNEFLDTVDKFIRYHYGTENFAGTGLHLEKNAEINNSVYDQTVGSLISVAGIKGNKTADSRTNISAIFALGLGDCRHHAQVKQILFDRWQGKKMKNALLSAYSSIDDKEKYNEAIKRFYDIYNVELRTIDVGVKLPIKIKSMYNAEKENGKFIESKNGEESVLEEHTMNILIRRDGNKLLKLQIADAFYQNNYNWKRFDVDIDNMGISDKGGFIISAGEISGKEVNSGKDLPITIVPAVYAGKRDVRSKDDHGNNITLLGIPLNILNSDDFVKLLQKRKSFEKVLNALRENGNLENSSKLEYQHV